MADWHVWAALSAMLALGGYVGVGLFLREFSGACVAVACASASLELSHEQQLHVFFLVSGLLLVVQRTRRRRRSIGHASPPHAQQ